MQVFLSILIVYIAVNLLMLVFKPVREEWLVFFDLYKDVSMPIKDWLNDGDYKELRWWENVLLVPIIILITLFMCLLLIIMTVIPIQLYKNTIYSIKHPKEPEHIIPDRSHWGANTDQKRISFGLNIPFVPDTKEVIYVENEYNSIINKYIQEHIDEIQQQYQKYDLRFVYLSENQNNVDEESIYYMFPYLAHGDCLIKKTDSIAKLNQHIVSGAIVGPALIHYIKEENHKGVSFTFSYCPLVPDSEVSLSDQFTWFSQAVRNGLRGGARYMPVFPQGDDVADACFSDGDEDSDSLYSIYMNLEDQRIIQEIRDRIHHLRLKGYKLSLLNDLIEDKPTLSRLVIDKDYRIFLPDYNNIEITMSPLPKAVFLLFLNHPEGISFKQLGDHYSELLNIYREVGNREVEENIKNSIRDITDPTKNSINEKCTRIREAFLKKFDYAYAKHYFITGKRGEPKKITLPRELVDLQAL